MLRTSSVRTTVRASSGTSTSAYPQRRDTKLGSVPTESTTVPKMRKSNKVKFMSYVPTRTAEEFYVDGGDAAMISLKVSKERNLLSRLWDGSEYKT